ncbi:MAG: hypothetical protein AAGJ81_14870 [Verrucomicrobiota bacterium]
MKCTWTLTLPMIALLVGCGPSSESPTGLLPEAERAPQFDRTSEFLQLGGVFYAFIDLTDEPEKLGETLNAAVSSMQESVPGMPPLPLNFVQVMDVLGLSALDAIGMSSNQIGEDFFHNRSILYFPEGVKGLFRVFGDSAGPFDSVELAPADADLVLEFSYEPTVLRDTVLAVADALAGPIGRGAVAAPLSRGLPQLGGRTINQLFESAGNRMILILDLDLEKPLYVGGFAGFPTPKMLLVVDGALELVESMKPAVAPHPSLNWEETTTGFEITSNEIAPPPFDFLNPVITGDRATGRMIFATNPEFLNSCLGSDPKLRDSEAFKTAANFLPPEGVSFTYATPELIEGIKQAVETSMAMTPGRDLRFNTLLTALIPPLPQPIASVSTVGPEGIYTASNLNTSHRTTVANLAIQPAALLAGVGSAMAIPAVQKVRETSQQKAVLNNLRQVASAGQQYMLEEGLDSAPYNALEGEYFVPISPVNGEDYTELVVNSSGGTLSVTMNNGDTVEYSY